MAGLATSLGSGAMTNSFAHMGGAKMIFLIGSNITEAHPVAGTLVKQAVRKGCRLIVADPRRTGIAKEAETHLQLRVGSDIALHTPSCTCSSRKFCRTGTPSLPHDGPLQLRSAQSGQYCRA